MELTTSQSTSSVTIHGALPAGELEPTVRQAWVRSSHAPASNSAGPTPSPRQTVLSTDRQGRSDGTQSEAEMGPASSNEVWQELVRMLVAREAAKMMHPSRGALV